ncbi:MAG: hypothetical protein GY861_00075, partial [bacterium]|nr:hypothetical protein [bacterium]
MSGEAQPVSRDQVSKESGEATSGKGLQSTPKLSTKKRRRTRNAPSDKRREIKGNQKFQEKEAERAVFAAKFFSEWRERQRQKEVRGLSADDARHKIVGRRIADPFEQKLYWKIPLVTEEDQIRFKRSIVSGSSFT